MDDTVNFITSYKLGVNSYMPLKDVVKVSRKTFFNPTAWLGYDLLKAQFKISWDLIKSLFVMPIATREETFDQAVQRFKLTDKQLLEISKNFLIYTLVFVSCAIITLIFSFYLLVQHGSFAGLLIGIAATAVFLAYAFRYSFWRFQIKQRKLGCTFDEWLHNKPKKEV